MAWRVFSVFVAVCVFVAVGQGLDSSADAPAILQTLGFLGALFAAVAVGSYVDSLPTDRRRSAKGTSSPSERADD